MHRLYVGLAIVVLFLVTAVLVAPSLIDVNRYHDRIQADLQKRFSRNIALGKMRLSVIPLAFQVDNVTIGEDRAFPTGHNFAQAQQLAVHVRLLPLLRGDVAIKSLNLRQPQIELVRNRAGVWNFSSLGESSGKSGEVSLAELKIEDGQVALTDYQKQQPRAVYDHLDLDVTDYAPGKPFGIMTTVHLPGATNETVAVNAHIGPINQENALATPFDGKLRLNQVSLSSLQQFLKTSAVAGMDAVTSGETRLRNEHGKLVSSGSLTLDHTHIHGTDIGYSITAEYDFSDDLDADVITIQKGALKLGSTPVSIAGTMNLKPTPAQIDVKVNTSNVSIEETARLLAALGMSFSPGMKIDGRLNAEIHAQGAANRPALTGTLEAHDLNITGKELAEPVRVNSIELAMFPQSIRSNSFSASAGSTRMDVQFTISRYSTPDPDIDLTLRTADGKVAEFLSIAKAYGVHAVDGMSGTGSISLDVHVTGPVKNAGAMNFSGTGSVRNASLRMEELNKPVEIRTADLKFTQNSVALENLAASLGQTAANGVLTLWNFAAPQVQFTLTADKMNVSEWQQMFAGGAHPVSSADLASRSLPTVQAAAAKENPLSKATGSGKLTIGSVAYDQMTLTNVHSDVSLDHGIIHLAPLTADLYGGQENGSVTIDARRPPMVYTVSAGLKNVDANKLLSSISSLKGVISGPLVANSNVAFREGPSDQIARTLNGTLSLNLKNGRLEGLDLLHELASVGQFLGYVGQPASYTNVVEMTGKFNVRDGVAQTDDLKAIIDGGTLGATGTVNLADQSLHMRLTAVLSKDMSQKVGGTGVGGFMNTALANNHGELVIPVVISGTLQHPKFAPDLEKVGEMKLHNLVPTSQDPHSLTNSVLGAIFGRDQNKQNKPPQKPE